MIGFEISRSCSSCCFLISNSELTRFSNFSWKFKNSGLPASVSLSFWFPSAILAFRSSYFSFISSRAFSDSSLCCNLNRNCSSFVSALTLAASWAIAYWFISKYFARFASLFILSSSSSSILFCNAFFSVLDSLFYGSFRDFESLEIFLSDPLTISFS